MLGERTVALITGGARGIGLAVGQAVVALGGRVVLADIDDAAGTAAATRLAGAYVHCDVTDPAASVAAVAVAVEAYGGLDVVHLNAGVSTTTSIGAGFDVAAYRRANAINLDGVVFGVQAALPALRRRGGGAIVATASLAGLTPVQGDPIYSANKSAVVALVRSLAPTLAGDGITIDCVCPGFADTAIIDPLRPTFVETGYPLLSPAEVADAVLTAAQSTSTGQAYVVQPGREVMPYAFRGVPGPRGVERTAAIPLRELA